MAGLLMLTPASFLLLPEITRFRCKTAEFGEADQDNAPFFVEIFIG